MSSRNIIYHVVFFTALLGICSLCSCGRDPGGIVEDSNDFTSLPCWRQSWEAGNWETLMLELDDITWNSILFLNEESVRLSLCDNCDSVRVLDFGNKKERTLFSPECRVEICDHKWIAGLCRGSTDLIEAGDFFVVQQRNYLFIFNIQGILGEGLDEPQVEYRVAKYSLKDKWHVKIDLSKVKWRKRKARKAFPIVSRKIGYYLFPTELTNYKRKFIGIYYDQYYGGASGPEVVVGDDAAKIAIIHKDDLAGGSIVDLRQYRFKSWEDGLGNRCDEDSAKTPDEMAGKHFTEQQIIQIAGKALEEEYYVADVNDCKIEYDEGNKMFNEYYKEIYPKLFGYEYQAVRFDIRGLSHWVCIDRKTGEALRIYVEQ